jgi:hypothetical protein
MEMLNIIKVNPKTNRQLLDRIHLNNHIRLYFNNDRYEDITIPDSN